MSENITSFGAELLLNSTIGTAEQTFFLEDEEDTASGQPEWPNSESFPYLVGSTLFLSLLFNFYPFVSICISRGLKSRTSTLMQNLFVSNIFLVASLALLATQTLWVPHLGPTAQQTSGHWTCKSIVSVHMIASLVAAGSITILVVDRCQSICTKRSYRITNLLTVALIVRVIWLAAILAVIPVVSYTTCLPSSSWSTPERSQPSRWSMHCQIDLASLFASKQNSTSAQERVRLHLVIMMLYSALFYVLPLLLMLISLGKIYCHLYRYRYRFSHDLTKRIRSSDREIVRMLTVLSVIFAITWAPFYVNQMAPAVAAELQHSAEKTALGQVDLWPSSQLPLLLLMLVLTPVIYVSFSRAIRERLSDTLRRRRGESSHSRRTSNTSGGTPQTTTKKNSLQKLLPHCHQDSTEQDEPHNSALTTDPPNMV